ncbi:hypothetical protein DFJ73DRAFT_821134 [Zopfochytrium polystomum]|nr:hypothetical protein DFJ73DRAFT_821134 [Zopfochytrium polystomum]
MTKIEHHENFAAASASDAHEPKHQHHQPAGGHSAKVVYVVPNRKEHDTVFVFASDDMLKQWKEDPESVPLHMVMDSTTIFTTEGHSQSGQPVAASRSVIERVFGPGTSHDDAVRTVLRLGTVHGMPAARQHGRETDLGRHSSG